MYTHTIIKVVDKPTKKMWRALLLVCLTIVLLIVAGKTLHTARMAESHTVVWQLLYTPITDKLQDPNVASAGLDYTSGKFVLLP